MTNKKAVSPPVLSFVGSSNSGKTTLMEKLVSALTAKGMRIATIKHSHHQPEMDTPGKDSWRHKRAGALASLLIGTEHAMMVTNVEEELTPQQWAERYFSVYDLVLAEGYASLAGAKIEIVRAEHSKTLRCKTSELIAVISDVPNITTDVPLIGLNDETAIIDFVISWMQQNKLCD